MQLIYRYTFPFIFVIMSFHLAQPMDDVYLLYNDSEYTYKYILTYNEENIHEFFYRIFYQNHGSQRVIFSMSQVQDSKPDTLSFSQLQSKDLKNRLWIKKQYLKFYHHFKGKYVPVDSTGTPRSFNLNKEYKNIYVVDMDSTHCRALVYKVTQGYVQY